MTRRFHQVYLASAYTIFLMTAYVFNISEEWSYMGFQKVTSLFPLIAIFPLSSFLALFIPFKFDTRSFLLAVAYYVFFIPSLIIIASNDLDPRHLAALLTCFILLFSISSLQFRTFRVARFSRKTLLVLVFLILLLNVIVMAAYGGLTSFNLNIFEVYEFRREASVNVPKIFGYIFSGTSKVVAPISLALAIYFRSSFLFVLSSLCILLLFGMTGHKSVLFLPFFVVVFFLVLKKTEDLRLVFFTFLGVGVVSVLEALYVQWDETTKFGVFNTFIVRRALFVPPLLDSLYLDFFYGAKKVYWSTSRFGLGISRNPYDLTAPFLIGREFFAREEMSANSGIIGSGFSHAGYIGVAIYATLAGLLLALLQAYGRVIGHAFVSAASLSIFMSIVTSTDFTTAILTHGLLLLIILLIFFPKGKSRNKSLPRDTDASPLYHSPPAY